MSRQITVETHIEDVANVIETEELRDIILVGHSNGGVAVTGVADRMTDRIPHRPSRRADPREWREGLRHPARRHGRCAAEGGAEARRRRGAAGAPGFPHPRQPGEAVVHAAPVPHPISTYASVMRLAGPAGAGLPVTYVACTSPALGSIEPSRQRARAKQGWRYMDLPVPHDVEIPDPGRVVEPLAGIG
ncbi:alpha/beta fold hydrolase [Roseomonas sp. GCM10028921]